MKKQDLVLLHYLEVVHHLNQYKNQKLDMVQHNLLEVHIKKNENQKIYIYKFYYHFYFLSSLDNHFKISSIF